jgi:hypothetical protein
MSMDGSDHCDGCFGIGRRGDILMWDNKSKESVYELPPSHQKQFKRYIRDAPVRVASRNSGRHSGIPSTTTWSSAPNAERNRRSRFRASFLFE